MTMEEVIAKVEQDSQPEKVLISIPEDKRKRIPDEICKILMGKSVSGIEDSRRVYQVLLRRRGRGLVGGSFCPPEKPA